MGIGNLIVSALVREGISEREAREKCWFFDVRGLVVRSRDDLQEHQHSFAHDSPFIQDFLSAIERHRPTAIIGVSGAPGIFSEPVISAMSRMNDRPIIFALSNPTSRSECTAEDAYCWSEGRVIFASGSPFGPVTLSDRTFVPGQGNNAYVFPGLGLGVLASGARLITDEMFFEVSRALANEVTDEELSQGRVYPQLRRIRDVSLRIACAVAEVAYRSGLADSSRPEDLVGFIRSQMYQPVYKSYV